MSAQHCLRLAMGKRAHYAGERALDMRSGRWVIWLCTGACVACSLLIAPEPRALDFWSRYIIPGINLAFGFVLLPLVYLSGRIRKNAVTAYVTAFCWSYILLEIVRDDGLFQSRRRSRRRACRYTPRCRSDTRRTRRDSARTAPAVAGVADGAVCVRGEAHDDMEAVLGFDGIGDLVLAERLYGVLKLRDHLALGEHIAVGIGLLAGVLAVLGLELREALTSSSGSLYGLELRRDLLGGGLLLGDLLIGQRLRAYRGRWS